MALIATGASAGSILPQTNGYLAGNGASRVSGVSVNPPASGLAAFSQYVFMGASNGPSTGAATPIVVAFPASGSYPYEFDYKSGTGGPLSFTATTTQGSSSLGVRPHEPLVLTTNTASLLTDQPASFSFTLQATDETGAPIASLPVTVNVAGITAHPRGHHQHRRPRHCQLYLRPPPCRCPPSLGHRQWPAHRFQPVHSYLDHHQSAVDHGPR